MKLFETWQLVHFESPAQTVVYGPSDEVDIFLSTVNKHGAEIKFCAREYGRRGRIESMVAIAKKCLNETISVQDADESFRYYAEWVQFSKSYFDFETALRDQAYINSHLKSL